MRRSIAVIVVLLCLLHMRPLAAQDPPAHETVTLQAADDTSLAADFYAASDQAPVLILLHMLNSQRSAYEPLIPDLQEAGYAILNVDLRGHGESDGAQVWDMTIADMQGWVGWLDEDGHLGEAGLAFIGASIGSNVALISCAETDVCLGAVALSPGSDFRGVQPESALVEGLAQRSALLVAAQADGYSAQSVKQMFLNADGDVSARLYPGRAHGTRFFDSDYDSVSGLILHWLDETFARDEE